MFAEDLDRARLGSLLADLLDITDARARHDVRCAVKDAIAVEVYFLTVGTFDEPELAARIDPNDRAYRPIFVLLGLSLHQPGLVLQSSAGAFEGIIDGEGEIGIAFVLLGGACNVDLAAIWQCQSNTHLVLPASPVPIARPP